MTKRADEHPHIFMPIPHQIEAEWNPNYAYLAGFPLNLMYIGMREGDDGARLVSCTYWFDPGTYCEQAQRRMMDYFRTRESPYWVRVSCDSNGSGWETNKYRNGEVICIAHGAEFETAMMQATLIGLRPDEPVDPEDEEFDGLAER
jgi:hypothetical protein